MHRRLNEYVKQVNERLPRQLRGFEYIFLDVEVKAKYFENLNKHKVEKKPLVDEWNTRNLEYYTATAVTEIEDYAKKIGHIKRLKHLNENKLNLALLIKSSPLCIIDIDSASITLKQIELLMRFTSPEKTKQLQDFISLLNSTFTVASGNDGYHHYFISPDLKTKVKSSKIKCFNVSNFLSDEEIMNFNDTVEPKYRINESKKLSIDYLSDSSYIILPPSSFTYFDEKLGRKLSNQYSVFTDVEIKTIPSDTFDYILDLPEVNNDSAKKKSKYRLKTLPFNASKIDSPFKEISGVKIDDITDDQFNRVISEDLKLKTYFKQVKTENPFGIRRRIAQINYSTRLNTLIERDYFDQNGYEFLAHLILRDYDSMNYYAEKKKGNLSYKYLSNVFECLRSETYGKEDRSSFEYAFVLLEIAKSMNPEVLAEIIKKEFSPNTKIYDIKYFSQLVNKIKINPIINSDFTMSDITQFYLDAQKINYRHYFGGSANSCASVFLALIERAIKIGRIDNDYWTLKFESNNNLGLMAHLDAKTVKHALKKLHEAGFIFLIEKQNLNQFNDSLPLIRAKFSSIQINKNKKFIRQEHKTVIPHLFVELQHISGIGKTGSMIYSFLLDLEPRTLNEIYSLFPDLKNPYNNIKPKVEFLSEIGLLDFNPIDETYISSTSKLYSKLLKAKEKEFKIKKIKEEIALVKAIENEIIINGLQLVKRSLKTKVKNLIMPNKKEVKVKDLDTNATRAFYAKIRKDNYRKTLKIKQEKENNE